MSVEPPPEITQDGPGQPGPPSAPGLPAAFPYAAVERGVTTIDQLLGELVRLDRHPGMRYPVLVEFPRCKHTVIFAVPRQQLTGTTYTERLVALWSRGCPVCHEAAALDVQVIDTLERAHHVLRQADRVLAAEGVGRG